MGKAKRMNLADLEPSPTTPDPVVQSIAAPEAGAHLKRGTNSRRRTWEKAHPTFSYKIPAEYHDRARNVREAIVGLAQKYQTTADEVAAALMTEALIAVEEGVITLEFRPKARGRKMGVTVTRGHGWAQTELPKAKKRKSPKPLWLGFRWSERLDKKITEIAQDAAKGAVVVLLLEASLEQIRNGNWGLRPVPVEVKQGIQIASSRKTTSNF